MAAFLDHPEYKRLNEFASGNVDQQQRTFMIYLDLIESKGWFNVALHPMEKDQVVLVGGHPSMTDERRFVWPIASDAKLSVCEMQAMISSVRTVSSTAGLVLGIVDCDSTIVYYSITDDLLPPQSPDDQNATKVKQRRKFRKRRMRQAAHEAGRLVSI